MKKTIVILLTACLVGCEDPPRSGYIYDKEYSPPYSWVRTDCTFWMHDAHGFPTVCLIRENTVINEPAHWRLCLIDDKKRDHKGCIEVDPTDWRDRTINSHYPDAR